MFDLDPHKGPLLEEADVYLRRVYDGPSAGWDLTALGREALRSLVGFKSSAALMDTAHAQAEKMVNITEVAKVRAIEAQRIVDKLKTQAEANPDALYYQIAGGPGFGNPNAKKPKEEGKASPTLGLDTAKGGDKRKPILDWDGSVIQENLQNLVALTRQAQRDAGFLYRKMAHADRMHNVAFRAEEDLFKYPGAYPPTPLPPVRRRPQVNRPSDLAPAWMDFIYANTPGSDPYEEWPEGQARESPDDILKGRQLQNPFGSPPLPTPWSAEDRGYDVGAKPKANALAALKNL